MYRQIRQIEMQEEPPCCGPLEEQCSNHNNDVQGGRSTSFLNLSYENPEQIGEDRSQEVCDFGWSPMLGS